MAHIITSAPAVGCASPACGEGRAFVFSKQVGNQFKYWCNFLKSFEIKPICHSRKETRRRSMAFYYRQNFSSLHCSHSESDVLETPFAQSIILCVIEYTWIITIISNTIKTIYCGIPWITIERSYNRCSYIRPEKFWWEAVIRE